ncbi:cytochrome P450 6a8-like isoform X2 [Musca autumnalis]|uniref:cytochrome P450 6a8-like isoform X2 n=1 Tax=Musca autumnalis TaxID=221902 RepID=UPI003CEC8829
MIRPAYQLVPKCLIINLPDHLCTSILSVIAGVLVQKSLSLIRSVLKATNMIHVPLAIFGVLIGTLLIWLRLQFNYWKRRNAPTVPTTGLYKLRDREHIAYSYQRAYNRMKAENKGYAGIYTLLTPTLLIADLDIIKLILITEFEAFPDRGFFVNFKSDPLSRNIARAYGELWRKLRTKITPTFTAARMRQMFENVELIGRQFIRVMEEEMLEQNHVVEVRDLCARFITDIVGNVAFGLDCNSLKNPKTEFRVMGDKTFAQVNPFLDMMASHFPKLFTWLDYKVSSPEVIAFYTKIVKDTVEYREKNNVKRNDFLDLMIELKNRPHQEGEYQLKMDDLIAQSFVFFSAGFETSSSTTAFALYEMAQNHQIQEKARLDIEEALAKFEGEFTYDCLNEMTYLRQVVLETLRKHPPLPSSKRICRRRYTFPDKVGLTVEPHVQVIIPVYAIHHDPEYYPQPEVFRPERFAPEERNKRHPMSYLPFGAGPRICIAERFGMMETMVGLALLLRNFKFSTCEQTPKQLQFDPFNVFVFSIQGGIHLKVEKVQK